MTESLRLDKWLWFARFCKTRTLAQAMITEGRVSVNGETVKKPNRPIRVGDAVSVVVGPTRRTVTVAGFSERRLSAPLAANLYDEPNPPERLGPIERDVPFHRPRGAGRPTKRDRRMLQNLVKSLDSD